MKDGRIIDSINPAAVNTVNQTFSCFLHTYPYAVFLLPVTAVLR